MRPLRILMLMDAEPNPDSGAAGTEMAIAEELRRQGHAVRTIWGDELPHRIRHWNLHHLLEQPRTYRNAIRRALAREEFDVLHVNQPAGWLAAKENRALRRPCLFVHRSHGFEPRIGEILEKWRDRHEPDPRPWHRRAATRLLGRLLHRNYRGIVRWADAHVVSCSECAEDLVVRGVPRKSVHVSAQVPVESFFQSAPPPWSAERARRFLFVGQNAFMKAPGVVAAALDRLLEPGSGRRATWVCEAESHEVVRARLSPAARERTELLGWMPRERLRETYDRHGVFLFPSYTEGFGKVFLEAMARGLCVVATNQSGPRDVLRHGENGFLVPVGDAEQLAACASRVVADVDLAARVSASARATAECYTWPTVVEDLVRFYRFRLAESGPLDRDRRAA